MYEPGAPARETPGLEDYLRALANRKWLILACVIAGIALGTLYFESTTPTYTATARVLVGPSPVNGQNNELIPPNLDREREVLRSNDTAKVVQDSLGLPGSTGEILAELEVSFRPDTDTLYLQYTDTDPSTAQAVVNGFATTYAQQRVDAADLYYFGALQTIETQLTEINARLDVLEVQVTDLSAQRLAIINNPNISNTERNEQLAALDLELEQARSERNILVNQANELAGQRNDVIRAQAQLNDPAVVLSEATRPGAPNGFGQRTYQALGAIIGLLLGTVVAFTLERLDKSFKESGDIELALGQPVLSTVPSFGWFGRSGTNPLVMASGKRSASVQRGREAIRRLRSSIAFLKQSQGMSVFVVSSARQGEGKSVVAANLAVGIAQSGSSVALVNADLRRPSLQTLFGLQNVESGLTEWLEGDDNVNVLLAISTIEGLSLVPAGRQPTNPSELLASRRFGQFVDLLRSNHDYVIIDTPPLLSTSDATAVVGRVDGVILVIDRRKTETNELLQVRADIDRSGGHLVGAVVNRERRRFGMPFRRDSYAYERAFQKAS